MLSKEQIDEIAEEIAIVIKSELNSYLITYGIKSKAKNRQSIIVRILNETNEKLREKLG